MGASLVPNPVTLGARALMFGLDNIENARMNQPGFPKGTEPRPEQVSLLQEGGATQLPGLGSSGPSIYSQASKGPKGGGAQRVGQGGRGGGKK